ncbi:MAG: archaetidylserine decarboxylase [Oscillospiraceae bacterium]|nr:archaetidylserine decarboxylase [Oscillospiraceae bacterium]
MPELKQPKSGVMICDREGNPLTDSCASQGKILNLMYGTVPGRALLKVLTKPVVSKAVGCALEHPLSTVAIPPFVWKKQIRMSEYASETYRSFNAFFTRSVKPSARPIDRAQEALISPCDAKLTVVPVDEDTHFTIKGAEYRLSAFLGCRKLAEHYRCGQVLIFRLTPDDYHRYCYPDDCEIGKTRLIPGELHTVNPVAAEHGVKVYHRNTRTVTMLNTAHFGRILQIEVGAMCVGRIVNHPHGSHVKRGIEKGFFEFGGSTIVMVLERNRAEVDPVILANSEKGAETVVRYGTRIGVVKKELK